MYNTKSFRVFILLFWITALIAGLLTFVSCNTPNHHIGGTCTYEGLECPNALQVHIEDSLAYADAEATIDILCDSITKLNTQLAGLEFKDHSEIPTTQVVGAGMIHLVPNKTGYPDLVYREHDGNEYYLDYTIDDYSNYVVHAKHK